jgi:hypothetical protein
MSVPVLFACLMVAGVVAPVAASGRVRADDAVEVSPTSTVPTPVGPTTTQVASGAPLPGAAVGAPRVGPLDAGVGTGRGGGVWWLFGLGAAQVATLFVMTRRSRARLSTRDVAP